MTKEGSGTPSWNYSWDGENRLSSISGSASDTFTYDGDGERVKKSNGSLFWRQHGGPFLTKTNLSGSISSERIYFNGLHVAAAHPPSGPVNYLFQDHLGGEHLVTDAIGGSICQDIDTLPFGSEIGYITTCASSYRFAGMDRDYEDSAQLDYDIARYYDNRLGRFISPDPAGMFAVRLTFPASLNRYSYVLNNPLSLKDPLGLDCVYLNDSGTDVESIDQYSNLGECGRNGGYWVEGGVTNYQIDAERGLVTLWGTTTGVDAAGNQPYTFAQYQDTTLNVGWYQNTWFNPFGHLALGIGNSVSVGLNPASDPQFVSHLIYDIANCFGKSVCNALSQATVPGAVLPQNPANLVESVSISITGMQATMIQNAINQDTISPPNYSILGPRPACDCGTWAQQMMSAGGVQSGPSAPLPQQLINQLVQTYGGR